MQMAEENMGEDAVQPEENHNDGGADWENDENFNDAEFQAINAQLDQLNCVLDNLEQKNDNILAELIDLLQSNREARRQFQECQESLKSDV